MNFFGSSISELLPFFVRSSVVSDSSSDVALWEMERGFWLSDAAYYTTFLAPDCIMVFPEPPGVLVGDEIIAALDKAPRWNKIEMQNQSLVSLDPHVAVLTYRATAQRGSEPAYEALCSSIYTHANSQWLLVHHQQTPLAVRPETANKPEGSEQWLEGKPTRGRSKSSKAG
ncbi:nuclear transport factor 2 family protein [Phyllobacterium endophyticum]|jgi:hypothetical protein|uniref:DUF4440 domain-containing protein n=1 Tax=Phyllobacterium endophyticum TaxID=1149773 RepID=A0A2P7B017_9HYPH|nr:nuclear transport factor 2 family protein [Phyllobacterium endophyticum]MBB3235546.1 hypothetical protein [Phyllobacterium endophyticum]PSH59817.1 hypothetical protein CU100_03395 [Phyllobacterium endophyticum]TYR41966.1 nuclear transport factor 2 family protein [Phyllobacterium endophyticum]